MGDDAEGYKLGESGGVEPVVFLIAAW